MHDEHNAFGGLGARRSSVSEVDERHDLVTDHIAVLLALKDGSEKTERRVARDAGLSLGEARSCLHWLGCKCLAAPSYPSEKWKLLSAGRTAVVLVLAARSMP